MAMMAADTLRASRAPAMARPPLGFSKEPEHEREPHRLAEREDRHPHRHGVKDHEQDKTRAGQSGGQDRDAPWQRLMVESPNADRGEARRKDHNCVACEQRQQRDHCAPRSIACAAPGATKDAAVLYFAAASLK